MTHNDEDWTRFCLAVSVLIATARKQVTELNDALYELENAVERVNEQQGLAPCSSQ